MKRCLPSNGLETAIPSLYPFATFRQEQFGGLAFNPYLGIEVELDPIETYCTAACNDHNSERQVIEAVRARFGLSQSRAQNRYESTKQKLLSIMALRIKQKREPERSRLPDSPVFPQDGPYYRTPKDVTWDITYACNLKCSHCLTSSGKSKQDELDTEQAFALIDRLKGAKILRVSLTGGEPFLRPDLVDIIRRITDTGMSVDIATNGLNIPRETLKALQDLPLFQIQVSIDGSEEEHDSQRGLKGAFSRSCQTVRLLRKEGFSVAISMTVTAKNLYTLDRTIDLALRLNCNGFKAIAFMPAGRGKNHLERLQLSPAEQRTFASIINKRSEELAGRLNIATETTFSHLLKQPPAQSSPDGPMGCSAGYDTLSIGANGTVYPCPFLQDFPLGNLLEEPLDYIWYKAPTLNTLRRLHKSEMEEPCRDCAYAPFSCRGGCRAAAYLEHGNLLGADPSCFGHQHAVL